MLTRLSQKEILPETHLVE